MNPLAIDGPAVEPVSLVEMKAYLRLDGTDEDDLVAALIAAARLTVEGTARLALIRQTWRLTLPAWPLDRAVILPLAPILSVDAVRAFDAANAAALVDAALYRLDAGDDPVRLVIDAAAPDAAPGRRIEIDLVCGFGTSPAAVPQPLRLAIKRLAARSFESRGDAESGPAIPAEVAALLAPYRRARLV